MSFQWLQKGNESSLYDIAIKSSTILTGGICHNCRFCDYSQIGPGLKVTKSKEFADLNLIRSMIRELFSPSRKTQKIDIICGAHHNPEFCASAEIFHHPQAKEILEMIAEESKKSDKKVCISSVFSNFNHEIHKAANDIHFYFLMMSANFLEPKARTKYMRTDDPERDIENVVYAINNFYNKADTMSVSLFYADPDSIKKSCNIVRTRISEEARKAIASFILTELAYTRYSAQWLQNDLKDQNENYLGISKIFVEELLDIGMKDNLLVWNLNKYMSIQQVLETYRGFKRMVENYSDILFDFRNSVQNSFSYIESLGYDLDDVGFIVGPGMQKTALEEFPKLNWIEVKHDYYGGNISATELLSFDDINKYIELHPRKYKLYVFTKKINEYKTDIAGKTLTEALGDINIELF